MRSPFRVAFTLASAGLAACAVPSPEPGPEAVGSTSATAIIAVERTIGPGDAVHGDTLSARFVRVRQGTVDDVALRVAGVAEDVPAPGACSDAVEATSFAGIQGRAVELLDVGQVTLGALPSEAATDVPRRASTILLPRAMPDPAGVVSGVFYSSRAVDGVAPGSRVALRSSGGADLDAFALNVTAPRDLADVRVTAATAPAPAGSLEITWDASDSDARDVVYVDVLAPSSRVLLRCTAAEPGRLALSPAASPGPAWSALSALEDGQLAVHRLHKESFKAKGIEPGEVRFDLARVVSFRR